MTRPAHARQTPARLRRATLAALCLLLLAACRTGRRQTRADPRAEAWKIAEAAWADRAAPDGPDRARLALEAVLEIAPRDMGAHARLARLEWTLGNAAARGQDTATPLQRYRNSLEWGYACLQASAGFSAALTATDGWPTRAALNTLLPAAAPCLAWIVAATLDLHALRGDGAMLAVDQIRPLHERATRLAQDDADGTAIDQETRGWIRWLSGRLALAARDPAALTDLRAACRLVPGLLPFRDTLARASPGEPPEPFAPPDPDPFAWENRIWAAPVADTGATLPR